MNFVLFLIPLALEGPLVLTAREAVGRAGGHASRLERASADVDRASAVARAAKSRLGPTLSVDLSALATNDPVDVFGLTLKQERFSATAFFASDPNEPSVLKDWSGAVSAFWPVDVSGGTRAAVRGAERMREAAEARLVRRRDEVAFETLGAFIRARRAEEASTIAGERLSDLERDLELAALMREQGLVTDADPARVRAAVAEARAERAGLRADRDRARAALARLVGQDALERPLGEIPASPVTLPSDGGERSDVTAARRTEAAGFEGERAARSARWPSVFLQGRFEVHAPKPGSRYGDSGSVMLGVRIPVFTSGALSSSMALARAEARDATAAARESAGAAEEEERSARANLAAAAERRAALEEGVAAARTAREIQRERYQEGAGRLLDLLDARQSEARARLGVSAARADEAIAGWALRLASGAALSIETSEVNK